MAVFRYQSSGSTVSRNHGSWDPRWRQLAEYVLLIILVLIQIVDFGRRNWKVKRTGLYRKEIGNDRNVWYLGVPNVILGPEYQETSPNRRAVATWRWWVVPRLHHSPGATTALRVATPCWSLLGWFIDVHRWWTIRLEVYDSPCDVIITCNPGCSMLLWHTYGGWSVVGVWHKLTQCLLEWRSLVQPSCANAVRLAQVGTAPRVDWVGPKGIVIVSKMRKPTLQNDYRLP
jgi:hypothetical protein